LLVLELRPPELPTFKAFLLLWPTWLSYAVSYLFIAIVWTNHHYLMHYATEATPRLLWFNFAHLFSMSLLPLSTAWMAVSKLAPQPVCVLCCGLLPRERNLHLPHLGAHSPKHGYRGSIDGAPDHALPIVHDFMPLRGGCVGSAEISAGWTRNLYLLPHPLSQARSAGSTDAEILAIKAETGEIGKSFDSI
jgi:Endosomal/lysosomal potassium channel TMEM175